MPRVLTRARTVETVRPDPTGQARLVGRELHPWAWWVWAIGCAVAVSMARNPLFLLLVVAAVSFVAVQRRTDAPWARSFWLYFMMAGFIITIRMVFQILIGGLRDGTELFRLPQIALPAWAAGIEIGGPVTAEGLVYTLVDAGRLGGLIICVGAASTLANPKRTLRNVPAAFHQVATAMVIAVSVAPQLVESVLRVRRARRLRGGVQRGLRGVVSVIIPVIEDAVERSLALAAGMESRGYGRTRDMRPVGRTTSLMLIAAMVAVTFAVLALLGLPGATPWGLALLAAGSVLGVLGIRNSGRRLAVSRYRPDRWLGPEWLLAACGLAVAAAAIWLAGHDQSMSYALFPLVWPRLSPAMVAVAVLAALPGVVTPRPPSTGGRRP